MNWIVKTLVGAVVAGVGWKFGADAYEVVKKKIKDLKEEKEGKETDSDVENGAGATETQSVEVHEHPDTESVS